jgi:hypothetical protein
MNGKKYFAYFKTANLAQVLPYCKHSFNCRYIDNLVKNTPAFHGFQITGHRCLRTLSQAVLQMFEKISFIIILNSKFTMWGGYFFIQSLDYIVICLWLY